MATFAVASRIKNSVKAAIDTSISWHVYSSCLVVISLDCLPGLWSSHQRTTC